MKMSKGLLGVLVLVGAAAPAQEPLPSVAPFPLEFVRTPTGFAKKDKEDLQKLMPLALRASDASVPDSARLTAALGELKRQDCSREDECLTQLAKLAGTLYGLYASIDFDSDGYVIATGRVVRDDGIPMGKPTTVKLLKGRDAFKDVARESINQLFVGLNVKKLSPFRPKVDAPVAVVTPTVGNGGSNATATGSTAVSPKPPDLVTPGPAASSGPPPLRIASYAALGAGALAIVGGGIRYATAGSFAVDANGNVAPGDAPHAKEVEGNAALGVGLLGAGVGLAAVGAVLFVLSGDAAPATAPAKVTLAPLPGGAAVVVGGVFE